MSSVVCIGDSLVAGRHGDLVNPLSNVLANKWNDTAVVNLGVGGDDIADIDARKSSVLEYRPAIVVCEFGTNNITNNASYSTIQQALQSLYQYFKTTVKANVWVLTIPPCEFEVPENPSGIYYNSHEVRLQINEWIRSKPTYVDLVTDAWTLVRDPSDTLRFAPEYRGTSGSYEQYFGYTNHWNQAGVNLIVDQMLTDLGDQ